MNGLYARIFEQKDLAGIDKCVLSGLESSIYQTSAWTVFLSRLDGFKPCHIVVRDGPEIRGVLPLFQVSRFPLGSKLISVPFDMSSGGPVSDSPETEAVLFSHAAELARELKVRYIEIRTPGRMDSAIKAGFREVATFSWAKIPLISEDENFGMLDKGRRTELNKFKRSGIIIHCDPRAVKLKEYYDLVLGPHFRRKGTPLPSLEYYEAMRDAVLGFNPTGSVLVYAESDGRMIGGGLMLCAGGSVVLKVLAVDKDFMRTGVGTAIVWECIKYGISKGYPILNYGIADNTRSGQAHFKTDMGSQILEGFAYIMAVTGKPVMLSDFSEGKTSLARNIWRMTPGLITDRLGPAVINWLC